MAQIHNLEDRTRFGSRYVAGFILLISSILLAGWFGFFVFLPIKSGMNVVNSLEEKFLPRAEVGDIETAKHALKDTDVVFLARHDHTNGRWTKCINFECPQLNNVQF